MIVRQRAYTRTRYSRVELVSASRMWTAEDYDLLERLVDEGVPFSIIRLYFTPSPSEATMRSAAYRAGFKSGRGRGRPTVEMRVQWMRELYEWRERQDDRRDHDQHADV